VTPTIRRHAMHTRTNIIVSDATVTPLANGFRVSGPATVTGNGNFLVPDFRPNTTVQIDVIGGNTVSASSS